MVTLLSKKKGKLEQKDEIELLTEGIVKRTKLQEFFTLCVALQ
jgi:hypothetical protein